MAKVTIKEIARLAGVSIGTVDRVINNRGNVKRDTEERIRAICGELGYESNSLAKALVLRKRESRIAAIIMPPDLNSFCRSVKDGFDAIAAQIRDYNFHFDYTFLRDDAISAMVERLDELNEAPPAGLIIKPMEAEPVRERLRELTGKGVPVITCTSGLADLEVLCFVGQNHEKEGRIAAGMIGGQLREGAEVAVLTGSVKVRARADRLRGFREHLALRRQDIGLVEVVEVGNDPDVVFAEAYGLFKRHGGLAALYAHTANPDGAAPVVKAARAAGRDGDVRIFTFGDRAGNAELLRCRRLAFVIAEEPFQHGYQSGSIMFNHLFHKRAPESDRLYLEAGILLPESL